MIPALLNELDILGCTITIDAMGCQKEIAETIIEEGGDYVLTVKKNHPFLCRFLKSFFERKGVEKESRLSRFTTRKRARGRIQTRECTVCNNLYWLDGRSGKD